MRRNRPKEILTKLIYKGRVFDHNDGSISHCFGSIKGVDRFWKRARYCQIGHWYEVTRVSGKIGDGFRMDRTPKDLGEAPVPPSMLHKWGLMDAMAEIMQRRKRAISKSKRETKQKLIEACHPLREVYKGFRTLDERIAFKELIFRVLEEQTKTKGKR